jgi:hypothetical protein
MKSKLVNRLYTGTFLAFAAWVLLLVYMVLVIPNGATMWADKQWADQSIRGAESTEQLRQTLHLAISSISVGQQIWSRCLNIFMFATVGMIGFLVWSLFLIRRLKRETAMTRAHNYRTGVDAGFALDFVFGDLWSVPLSTAVEQCATSDGDSDQKQAAT